MRHIFFAERNGTKVPGLKATPRVVKKVGIVGAGLMGQGIAMCCANVGQSVVILDISQEAVDKGMKAIGFNYARSIKRGSRTKAQKDQALASITGTTSFSDLRDVDLVVEAVFEVCWSFICFLFCLFVCVFVGSYFYFLNPFSRVLQDMSVKKNIFAKLDSVCKDSAILCTNTSALDIDEIASVTQRPKSVMGAHFFSPANAMKLLENVRGKLTSDVTIASVMEWGKRLGKWAILVGNCHGFVGNRMVYPYRAAARRLALEGNNPVDIDDALRNFGMRMGPLAMGVSCAFVLRALKVTKAKISFFTHQDLIGLDLGIQVARKQGKFDPKSNIIHALVDAKRCGLKSKAGWFDYKSGKQEPSLFVADLLASFARENSIQPRLRSADQIVESLLYPLINEGFCILQEGMAQVRAVSLFVYFRLHPIFAIMYCRNHLILMFAMFMATHSRDFAAVQCTTLTQLVSQKLLHL